MAAHARKKPTTGQTPKPAAAQAPRQFHFLIPVFVAVSTLAAFLPALQNNFVDWDDAKTLVENQNYRGLGWSQIHWMITTFHMGHYQPLSWFTFGLDYLIWGMDPFGYHQTNLILHALNAALFYFIALRLLSLAWSGQDVSASRLRLAAGFAALLFAVHPLRVESVAWATERRDVLSGLFFLFTLYFYLRAAAATGDRRLYLRWLGAAVAVYLVSLLAKASGIVLPVVLLILDVYPLKRLGGGTGKWLGAEARRIALEKAPFAILAVIFGMVALRAQEGTGALKAVERYDLGSRFAQGLYGLVFYLWKSVLPLGLSPLYELPLQLDPRDWQFILSGFVVLAVSAGVYLFRRAWPAGVALWIYYLVVLLPVLGIAQSGPQLVADRYSYLSCLGWAILGGAGLKYLWVAAGRITAESRFLLPPAIAAIVVFILGVATWRQTRVWSDSESLWKHALAVGQESSTVHFNLGHALQKRGDLTQAVEHYRKSLEFNPLAADAHYYLADALAVRGLLGEAVEHYGRAIEINPEFWGAHYNLAIVLERQGKLDAATGHYRRAVAINPADVEAHNNLALVLSRQGEFNEAAEYFRESLKVAPSQSRVYLALANIMARQGDYEQAVQNYRQAIRIQPNYAAAHEGLARVLAQQGKKDEAMRHYSEALSLLKSRRGAAPASR